MAEKFSPLHYITVILAVGLIVSVVAFAWAPGETSAISVSGYAEITAEPNEATLYMGATSQGITADAAQRATASAMDSIMSAVASAGVSGDDIETYSLSVEPLYDWDEWREITGYEATHILKIKTEDMGAVGDIISAAVSAGANVIDSIDYSVDRETEASLKAELLGKASLDARAKAESMAGTLGVRLVRIKSASESVSFYPYRSFAEAASPMAGEVPPGKVELSGSVSIEYEIA
jgi:uncharacterized protein YggE